MGYLGNTVSDMLSGVFLLFFIAAAGTVLGSIKIKGFSLGAAGVLIAAVCYGALAHCVPAISFGGVSIELFGAGLRADFAMVSSLGAVIFISAVGMSAGPDFFRSFSGKTVKYALVSVIIILTDAAAAAVLLRLDVSLTREMCVGIMTGALTSTPGLSAAKEAASGSADMITAGYGIAYFFGVLGVVLFVQLVPRLEKCGMALECSRLAHESGGGERACNGSYISLDRRGFFPVALTIVLGCLIGAVRLPKTGFSFGSTGGTLIAGLVIGHFGHIGRVDCRIDKKELDFLRQLGLVLFLTGSGVPAGVSFLQYVRPAYFFYGAVMTVLPMIVGFFVMRRVFKIELLNCLGAITGGMTSTPALGTLIAISGSDEPASAYAASDPAAMVTLVIIAKIMTGGTA